MTYYLEVQEDGSTKKVPKKKGPTRKGWIQNPNNPEEYLPDPSASVETEKPSYLYIRFDSETGEYANHKPVGRGRKPLTYVKFMKVDNELKLVPGEELPKNANTSTIPAEIGIIAEGASQVTPIPETASVEFEVLKKCLKAGKFEKSGPLHVYKLVDVVGDPQVEYLRQHRAVSRIEVNTESGDVSVWNVEYNPDQPDAHIAGIVK